MPRRYAPDGTPLFYGKKPEQFTPEEIQQFTADTETRLQRKETITVNVDKKENPQETEQAAIPLKLDISVRPIDPIKNLVGFANIKINDCFVVEDFKILQSDKGLFVGMPSKPDKNSRTGYRDMAKPITKEFRSELTEVVISAYHAEVEKLQARAAAIATPPEKPTEKQSIPKQLAEGKKRAAKENTARPAPAKTSRSKSER